MAEQYRTNPNLKKQELFRKMVALFKGAQDFIFTDYSGLSVAQFQEFRTRLREHNATYTVIKNRIAQLAFDSISFPAAGRKLLIGPSAIICATSDGALAAKMAIEFARDNTQLKLKGSVLNNIFYNEQQTTEIASLPSRAILLSALMSTMQNPIQQLVGILHTVVAQPLRVLNEVAKQKK